MSTNASPTAESTGSRELGSKLLAGFVCLAITAALWCGLYFGVFPHHPDWTWLNWLTVLLTKNHFQYVNTFVFLLSAVVMGFSIYDCLHNEGRGRGEADSVAAFLRRKWHGKADDSKGASTIANIQRDQGKDILEAMAGNHFVNFAVAGDPSSSQLVRQNLYLHRIYRIGRYLFNTKAQNVGEMMDINRDLSALDDDSLSSRLTLVRYFVYLIPVIGFLGTVYGIGEAMGGISEALPNIEELKGFLGNLTRATRALQVSFDATLLALIYSGLITLVLTVANWVNEDFLARMDTWMIDNILCYITEHNAQERLLVEVVSGLQSAARETASEIRALDESVKKGAGAVLESLEVRGGETATSMREAADRTVSLDERVHKIHGVISKLYVKHETAIDGVKEVGKDLARAADACEEIRRSQGEGHGEVKELATAVRALPHLADSLSEAASKIEVSSSGIASLGDLVNQLAELGRMMDQVNQAVDSLSSISMHTKGITDVRNALTKEVENNGQLHRLDAISAIQEMNGSLTSMNDALAQQIGRMSQDNAEQISNAMQSIATSNDMLDSTLKALHEQMGGLLKGFVGLANEIRTLASRSARNA